MNRAEYNCMDCCATHAIAQRLLGQMDETARTTYLAEMRLQAAALRVSMRGLLVDRDEARAAIVALEVKLEEMREEIAAAAGQPLNPQSPVQLCTFFYDEMELARQRGKDGNLTTDATALMRIAGQKVAVKATDGLSLTERRERKARAATVATLVTEYREKAKMRSVIKAKKYLQKIRSNFNVGSTETFRFSATKTPFGDGTNLQNITPELRRMFVPRPGWVFVAGDQNRAESTLVAYLSGDPAYIEAHKRDTHTHVARLIWPEEKWTGEDETDKELANEPNFLRHFSRRDLAKRVQHGSNYGGSEYAIARVLGVKVKEAKAIQDAYFAAFPGIREWHKTVAAQLKSGVIELPGYRRQFFGRLWSDATQREAIAHIPQSIIAWNNHIVFARLVAMEDETMEVVLHKHDEVMVEVREEALDAWLARLPTITDVHWPLNGYDVVIDWTWGFGKSWAAV